MARVTEDCWGTPQALGPWHKSPERAGRHRVPTGTGPILPGLLIEPVGTRTRARIAGTVGQTRGNSDYGTSRPGQLVDTAGSLIQARIIQDSWGTPRDFGHGPESTGTAD